MCVCIYKYVYIEFTFLKYLWKVETDLRIDVKLINILKLNKLLMFRLYFSMDRKPCYLVQTKFICISYYGQ